MSNLNTGVCIGGSHAGRTVFMLPEDPTVPVTYEGVTENYSNTGVRAGDGRALLLPTSAASDTAVHDYLLFEYQSAAAANRAAIRALARRQT
jgi:hypothetical protein